MHRSWEEVQKAFVRVLAPLADLLIRLRVSPNVITSLGTAGSVIAGVLFASGQIRAAGWVLGLTAIFDVLDGSVARRGGRASRFGAFYDSTLDRIADGALLGGIALFYATETPYRSVMMVAISLVALVGTFVTSYTRARAESIGVDAKLGLLQRPERIVLLAVPQAVFGLALEGLVLGLIVVVLATTAWVTVAQRLRFVHTHTGGDRVAS